MQKRQKFKLAGAVAVNVISLAVILLLAGNSLAQSFAYRDSFGTEHSHLTMWQLIFLVPLAVNILVYFYSRYKLKNPTVYSIAFANRRSFTVIAFILAAVLTVTLPWLATMILSPAPVLGSSFWQILAVGAALNALAGAGSIYLLTPLAR